MLYREYRESFIKRRSIKKLYLYKENYIIGFYAIDKGVYASDQEILSEKYRFIWPGDAWRYVYAFFMDGL